MDPRILWVRDIISDQMLVTGLGDEMCWRQLWDVGYRLGRFRQRHDNEHPLFTNIYVAIFCPRNFQVPEFSIFGWSTPK